MNIHYIKDWDDPGLIPYRSLVNNSLPGISYFIAETHTVIQNAIESGCVPLSFLAAEKYIYGRDKDILELFPDVTVYTAPEAELEKLTGYKLTRGILSAMERPASRSESDLIISAERLVVLENVQDASNVGAIMRSACGLGMDGIILDRSCCDPLHRKAVRTSMGAVFRIPWIKSELAGHELSDVLNRNGFMTIALTLSPEAIPIQKVFESAPAKCALFLGNEGNGLNRETVTNCQNAAIIPMMNNMDSLNVAAAAAIVFWASNQSRKQSD